MKKRYALFVLLPLAFAACSKSNDVTPDAGTQVAGTYTMTNIRYDSAGINVFDYTLPLSDGTNTLSGTITARRDSAAVVYVTATVKQTGYSDSNNTFGQLKLQGSSAPYDLYYGTTKVGTADGKTITIDYTFTDQGISYRQVLSGAKPTN
ncbi:hypothetical protein WBJ53_07575 [Spirosoma sp. SC4-14]|uniref:hypothetical protein n=1 Tax=Spirosoma sp. SC4-14 TaxID=3128900 RepID=UPI0030CDF827